MYKSFRWEIKVNLAKAKTILWRWRGQSVVGSGDVLWSFFKAWTGMGREGLGLLIKTLRLGEYTSNQGPFETERRYIILKNPTSLN